MESITYYNMKVEGTPITKVTQFDMEHAVGSLGSATVAGEVTKADGEAFAGRATYETMLKITTSAEGQPPVLFIGVVDRAYVTTQDEYAILHVQLKSVAARLDDEPGNKSFQNLGSSFEEVITASLKGKARLNMKVSDKPIGQLMMQYQETPWAFAGRMASQLGASISTNVTTQVPVLTVGMPDNGKSYTLLDVEYDMGGRSSGGAAGTTLSTTQYMEIGDKVSYGSGSGVVTGVSATIQNGILRVSVTSGQKDSFQQKASSNGIVSGKMFKGIVQAVRKDKVQVHLVDIDSSYDAGGNLWLPYSTAYSSGDGSGFYCMPQEGDEVRVFFPSNNEKDAFAASSVNVSPLDNPKHKKWRSPAGKEILLTEGGLFITSKEQKIFINLEDEKGITICSDSDINVMTVNNMLLYAQKEMKLQSENKILLSTGTSYIDMTPKEIQLGAERVTIK